MEQVDSCQRGERRWGTDGKWGKGLVKERVSMAHGHGHWYGDWLWEQEGGGRLGRRGQKKDNWHNCSRINKNFLRRWTWHVTLSRSLVPTVPYSHTLVNLSCYYRVKWNTCGWYVQHLIKISDKVVFHYSFVLTLFLIIVQLHLSRLFPRCSPLLSSAPLLPQSIPNPRAQEPSIHVPWLVPSLLLPVIPLLPPLWSLI